MELRRDSRTLPNTYNKDRERRMRVDVRDNNPYFVGLRGTLKAWLVALSATVLAACGGGGGGGGSNSNPSASLSYPSGSQTFTVGTAITPISPTITGTLSGFVVTPALPAGLVLNTSTGVISGTPTAIAAAASYAIGATGTTGVVSATVSITVSDIPPSGIAYGASSYTFSANVASKTLNPTVNAKGGAIVGWSINPALPAGMYFDPTTGQIAGIPAAASTATPYTITAQNSGGQVTTTLTIAIDAGPLMNMGHQASVGVVRANATNALSVDWHGDWILWNYANASVVATGNACNGDVACPLLPVMDLTTSAAVLATATGLEIHSTTDGHLVATITTSAQWWQLASDGSYIVAGGTTGLWAWSLSGTQLFSLSGQYATAAAFAAPGKVLIGGGPAGANVIQTIAVPSGASTTSAPFNGTFGSWFTDGSAFTTVAGTTALIYSNTGTQQGLITSVPSGGTIVGQGGWVWTLPKGGGTLTLYPATGMNPAPAATYAAYEAFPSGTALLVAYPNVGSKLLDLSGATPVETDLTTSVGLSTEPLPAREPNWPSSFAYVSASQWLAIAGPVLVDGTSLSGTPRYFGSGIVTSIAGSATQLAVATDLGTIFYFNASTWALEGQIAFNASKLAMSADGTELVAMGQQPATAVQVYSLPAGGSPVYTWPYTYSVGSSGAQGTLPQDIQLSSSGNMLGQYFTTYSGSGSGTDTEEASAPTGGTPVFSTSGEPVIRISPNGTLFALANDPGVQESAAGIPATNIQMNATLVTAFSGMPVGWLDDGRLLANSYTYVPNAGGPSYTGCVIYGANGLPTGAPCAISTQLWQFQVLTSDTIYAPDENEIFSVSTGNVLWASGDASPLESSPAIGLGPAPSPVRAVAGSRAVFVYGTNLLAQPY